jgi:hypothetical protein
MDTTWKKVKWKWEGRPSGAIVLGKMRMAGYTATIISYPPMYGYSDRHFLIAEITDLHHRLTYRLHPTKRDVKETYSTYFDIKDINFGLCYDEQD